jgi:hypothetical protein
MDRKKWLILIGILFVVLFSIAGLMVRDSFAASGNYKILAWNDLGMHCYSRDFADLAVLPPYNTLWVQVVKAGNPPELVTSGIRVEYFYADNTDSAGKTNFWNYDQALFGVDLPLNVGLKGKGLSGTMDLSGDHFVAEGIPITEFSDSAPTVRQPYQLATVVVKDSATGEVLTSMQVVTPTSSEMRCDNCHSDTGIAKPSVPTGKVETNILRLHDEDSGTKLMANRPVLCASCHASNALGAPGKPGIKNLSKSMHEHHAGVIPSTLEGCYNCHPGPQTRCLRDVMSIEKGMICSSCHGSMATVSNNPNPWLNEPRCDACHNSGRYNQDQPLYRFSKGHGGLYCEACHDSTHAIAPSREANDAIKFNQLQGRNGPLEECSVCHTVIPSGGGTHNLMPPSISGNVGAGGVTLSYTDGLPQTIISNPDGSYSLPVSNSWSGTVTPSHPCYSFSPASRTYNNVTANQAAQNYIPAFNNAPVCAVTVGVFRPNNGLLYLKNSNTTGFADIALNYGLGGDYPVVGDWDGNGTTTIGIYRNGSFYLRNSNTVGFADLVFAFGMPGDQPIAGDWDGNGVDTIGIYRPSNGQFLMRNSNSAGAAEISFYLGNVGDVGIAGDWDGDGIDTTGVFRPSNGIIFLKNTNTTGFADIALNYGLPGDKPVIGDWNNDGIDTIGVYRNGQFMLRDSNTVGFADIVFGLGIPGDMPVAGNWDGQP